MAGTQASLPAAKTRDEFHRYGGAATKNRLNNE